MAGVKCYSDSKHSHGTLGLGIRMTLLLFFASTMLFKGSRGDWDFHESRERDFEELQSSEGRSCPTRFYRQLRQDPKAAAKIIIGIGRTQLDKHFKEKRKEFDEKEKNLEPPDEEERKTYLKERPEREKKHEASLTDPKYKEGLSCLFGTVPPSEKEVREKFKFSGSPICDADFEKNEFHAQISKEFGNRCANGSCYFHLQRANFICGSSSSQIQVMLLLILGLAILLVELYSIQESF